MKTNQNKRSNIIIASIIGIGLLIGILSRFTEIPNFTAIGAIALFSGAYFSNRKISFFLPLLILFVSNFILMMVNQANLSFLIYKSMIFVYGSYVLIIALGRYLQKHKNPIYIAGGSIVGSILFFLISNFGVWITKTGTLPTNTLLQVYADGLLFFRHTLISDFICNAVFFTAAYFLVQRNYSIAGVNEK